MGLVLALLGCGGSRPHTTGNFDALQLDWFFVPGPYQTRRETKSGVLIARVSAEVDGSWTVSVGEPAQVIRVVRLGDGRPATAWIANPDRRETAVFEPPLAMVPGAETLESSGLTIFRGVHVDGPPLDLQPKNTGTATRRFLGLESTTWSWQGLALPAQVLRHELALSLSPALVLQTFESTAVAGMGIVEESTRERLSIFGAVVRSSEEHTRVVEFLDDR